MAKTRGAYPPAFRRRMIELVHAGRTPEELADEFEPTAQSIRNWVAQWERNAGRGDGGLTTAEREELSRLRRENRQLRLERALRATGRTIVRVGRKNGSARGRTKECLETGGQHAVRSGSLIQTLNTPRNRGKSTACPRLPR